MNSPTSRPWALLGTVLTVFLVIFLVTKTVESAKMTHTIGRPAPQDYSITVEGTARVAQPPTIAIINIDIESVDQKSVDTAETTNSGLTSTLMKKLTELGVAEADLRSTNYSSYKKTRWDPSTQREEPDGWVVRRTVEVKVRDVSQTDAVIQLATKNGATSVSGPNFNVDDLESVKEAARAEAIEQAKKRAEGLETSLGVNLTDVVGFNEWLEGNNNPTPYYRAEYGGAGSSIAPGTSEYTLRVNLTYRIKPTHHRAR